MAEITIIDGQIVEQDPAGTGVNVRDGVLHKWEEEATGGIIGARISTSNIFPLIQMFKGANL